MEPESDFDLNSGMEYDMQVVKVWLRDRIARGFELELASKKTMEGIGKGYR